MTAEIARRLRRSAVRLLPVTDDRAAHRSSIVAGEGEIDFQEYFVGRRHEVPITGVRFDGADDARLSAPGRRRASTRPRWW